MNEYRHELMHAYMNISINERKSRNKYTHPSNPVAFYYPPGRAGVGLWHAVPGALSAAVAAVRVSRTRGRLRALDALDFSVEFLGISW